MAKKSKAQEPQSAQSAHAAHEPIKAERTRISAAMVAVTVAVVFLVLLIVFIAQNNHKVPIHFLWLHGNVSEAIALVGSAVAGAVLVLAVGLARIIQMRVAGRRHNRAMRKRAKQADAARPEPAADPESVVATPQGGPEPVEAK